MHSVCHLGACALLGLALLIGCKSNGDSELRGVRYHLDLQGSYTMVARNDREQVWVPSTDDRPFISIQVKPRPRENDKTIPCQPGEDGGGTSYGGFHYVRKGDGVDLVAGAAPPHGVTVSGHRCLPPGDEALECSASYADGEMPADREAQARAACKSLVAR